jgi:hypothetical protein
MILPVITLTETGARKMANWTAEHTLAVFLLAAAAIIAVIGAVCWQ